jgi:polar amino acid transport system substrate-binding protein
MMDKKSLIKSLTLTVALSSFSFLAHAETVFTVAFEDKAQFPYYMGNSSTVLADKPGATVELIKRLESKIPDLKVVFQRCPVKRCLNDLETGAIDALFNLSFKESRLKMGAYPWKDGSVDTDRKLTTINYSFYKKKGTDFDWDGKNVSGTVAKIGAPTGYSIVGDLTKMGLTVSEAPTSESNFKKLLAGRISAVALQDIKGDILVKDPEFSSIVKVETPIKVKPYYLVISNQFKDKNTEMAENIWSTLAELKEQEFDKISEKYYN